MKTLSILKRFEGIMEGVFDILLPRFCVGCGREGKYICENCEVFLNEAPNTVKNLFTVWEYEGLMEKIIWQIKYEGRYDMIGELVEKAFGKMILELPADTCITFVPMYKKRERERGFNQSELIAKAVGKRVGREVVGLLKKVKDNRSQVGLSPKERLENVKGVFAMRTCDVHQDVHQLRNVLLVDDVYTTGATVNECCKALRKNGIKNIWVFTLARKLNL